MNRNRFSSQFTLWLERVITNMSTKSIELLKFVGIKKLCLVRHPIYIEVITSREHTDTGLNEVVLLCL